MSLILFLFLFVPQILLAEDIEFKCADYRSNLLDVINFKSYIHSEDLYSKAKDARQKISFLQRRMSEEETSIYGRINFEEKLSINLYTGNHYRDINSKLRTNPKTVNPFIRMLCSAINKLPSSDEILYRGAVLPINLLEKYKEGSIVTEDAFTSTSLKEEIARNFSTIHTPDPNKVGIIFKFFTNQAADISQLSHFDDYEKEYLLPAGSSFRVTKVMEIEPAKYQIELEDLDQGIFR